VCRGVNADFNRAEGYGGQLDPKKPEDWPLNRILSPEFLMTILVQEPYLSALPHQGVHITGGWFKEPLQLSSITFAHKIRLSETRFDTEVFLGEAHIGSLDMSGSTFTGSLNMDRVKVDRALFMRDKAQFAEVLLRDAHIGSSLDMNASTFTGSLNMARVKVDGVLFMRDKAQFAEVLLENAHIGSTLDMSGSIFTGDLLMENMHVGGYLLMSDTIVTSTNFIKLIFTKVGIALDLSADSLPSLDLTGMQVSGELRLGWSNAPKWQPGSTLTLRNATVGALQGLRNAWPDALELDGFTYTFLGGAFTDYKSNMGRHETAWFKQWLARQPRYSPQPYEYLASILEKIGRKDDARAIRYTSRERERSNAEGLRWWWLSALKVFIGYGYRYWHALFWTIGMVMLGMIVLWKVNLGPKGRKPAGWRARVSNTPYVFFYSLGKLLPIVKLDKRHDEPISINWVQYYFYVHQLIGYVLAFFLVAGLSGLTK
jgi:hypothetical protein